MHLPVIHLRGTVTVSHVVLRGEGGGRVGSVGVLTSLHASTRSTLVNTVPVVRVLWLCYKIAQCKEVSKLSGKLFTEVF